MLSPEPEGGPRRGDVRVHGWAGRGSREAARREEHGGGGVEGRRRSRSERARAEAELS